MKKSNRKYFAAAAAFLAVYILLLELLVIVERGDPESHIHSFGDALWFSLVTLSTVGFGDVTPVSRVGHLIGGFFVIMSMGLLVALIGSAMSFLTSEGFPMMRLRFRRNRDWYYFSEFTSESDALAKDILKKDEEAVIIYGSRKDDEIEEPDYLCFFINISPARIVAHKKDNGSRCKLFFLKENEIGFNIKANNIHELNADVYAATASGQEKLSGNIHFFHTYDCCARSYWRSHPLDPAENEIVIIGFGNYGQAILERAILTNIVDPDFDVTYHVFGDAKRFREIHKNLGLAFGINEKIEGLDTIIFHGESWTSAHDEIEHADRVIICEDDVQDCWDDMWQLRRYYNCPGEVYLRTNRIAPGVCYFGTTDEIYTVDQIIRTKLNDAAIAMNDLYRSSVDSSLGWEELSDQLKQSKIAAADHLFMKMRLLLDGTGVPSLDRENCRNAYEAYCEARKDPERLDILRRIEHARWTRFYIYHNWTYGEKRDPKLRENPMIQRFDQLTEGQKAYHDRAWELLGEMASKLF